MTPQQQASLDLARWQELRNAGLTPEQRLDALVADFFLPIPPCDVEFDAIMRRVSEEMAHV